MTDRRLQAAGIESALDRGVDIWGRRIWLHGDITEETIGLVIRGLYLISDLDPERPIELYVSSYGGEIDATFALHDVTRTIRAPIHTVALGTCMSAAPLLVACGTPGHRFASPNALFMLHTGSFGIEGSVANVRSTADAIRERCARMDRLLAEYTQRPYRHWSQISRRLEDSYFDAETAVEWGIVDAIWSEKD